jgi:hypothetical protein
MSETCAKTYTIDRHSGERLTCSGKHLLGNPFRDEGLVHTVFYGGVLWTWYDRESDKESA